MNIGAVIGVLIASSTEGLNLSDQKSIERNGTVLGCALLVALPAYIFAPILFAYLRKTLSIKDYLAFRSAKVWEWIFWTIVCFATVFGVGYLFQLAGAPEQEQWMVDIWKSAGTSILFLIGVIIVAPIGEEWLFRGFLFKGWKESVGPWAAIILSAVAWAAIHLQYSVWALAHLFIFGIVLGVARWKTKSILIPIWMHFVNNLVATLMMHLSTNG